MLSKNRIISLSRYICLQLLHATPRTVVMWTVIVTFYYFHSISETAENTYLEQCEILSWKDETSMLEKSAVSMMCNLKQETVWWNSLVHIPQLFCRYRAKQDGAIIFVSYIAPYESSSQCSTLRARKPHEFLCSTGMRIFSFYAYRVHTFAVTSRCSVPKQAATNKAPSLCEGCMPRKCKTAISWPTYTCLSPKHCN